MKQWLKRTQSPQTGRSHQSPLHSRQFRQVITRLTEGFAVGHFLAYCLVSKQSSYGIFLNERLLALDTQARELRYYSHIPQLPLRHPRDLPAPKEVLHVRPGVEFQLEKVRIGHVSIRWEENRQSRLWKLIMGNNQIAKEFYELFMQVLSVETEQAKAREVPIGKQYKISKVQPPPSPFQYDFPLIKKEEKLRESPTITKNENLLSSSPQRIDNFEPNILMKQSSSQRLNISLHESRPVREEAQGYLSSRYKVLQLQPSPKLQKEDNSLQRTGLMAMEWLHAKDEGERIALYYKFVQVCSRKVQLMMQNFLSSHLMHEQFNRLHLIRDNDIEVYYVPLINSTEEEPFSSLFSNIQQETAMIEEWQCLNYLSTFRQVHNVHVLTPLACLITYKSFKFFCKNSLEIYPHKQKLLPSQFQQEIATLQELTHLSLRNGSEEIYLIHHGKELILYFDHIQCLPKITPFMPVNTKYINLYITRGVVSNQKDMQAISEHISIKLINKTLQNLRQKTFSTSCEVMDFICQSGLSQHYLSFFLNGQQQEYVYVQRLIASELVACAAEWEIRRRMQVQLFKKREFGFAVNQVRTAIALLLQEDRYFMTVINEILKGMFNFTLPQKPIKFFIEPQAMVISLLNRLGFDCRGAFLDAEQMDKAWTQNYINDYIELTPFISTELLRYDSFSQHQQILNSLISQINYEINTEVTLEQVLNILALRKNPSGLYPVSLNYTILPHGLKMKVNYYLSHFISPSFEPAPQQSLQAMIYGDSFALTSLSPHYYTHTIQHLTTLNKVRWLARMKYLPKVEQLLEREVEQAITWSQLPLLIQIYSFAAKLKFRQGEITIGLQCSLKALQYALKQYEKEPTVLMELVIAEQTFESANFHFNVHNFSKALQLYSTVQDILSKISTSSDKITLNPQFLDLYVNKCSIHLLFGDYAECFDQCLSSLRSCNRFNSSTGRGEYVEQQFRIYEILFRCYQIKNMRKEVTEVTCICSYKFFQDPVFAGKQANLTILGALVKMVWISVIKQIESLSTTRSTDLPQTGKLKTVYLKKVRKELKQLRGSLNDEHKYTQEEASTFMARKIFKYQQPPEDCRLIMITIDCLSEVTLNSRSLYSSKLYDKQSLDNQWLTLEMIAVLAGYDFLVGVIDDYLRIYDFEP